MSDQWKDRMRDYVPVNERIAAFYEKYPNGSLQSEMIYKDDALVVIKAYAYRDGDDSKPGIGHSSLQIPGPTSFTKGSEIENAETSAWGRALAALGFEVKRGIATQNEIDNKRDDNAGAKGPVLATKEQRAALVRTAKSAMKGDWEVWLKQRMDELKVTKDTMGPYHVNMLTRELVEFAGRGEQNQDNTPPEHEDDINF